MNQEKTRKWSAKVTHHSHALDLEKGVFTWQDPHKIAESLLHSAEESKSPQRYCLSISHVHAQFLYK